MTVKELMAALSKLDSNLYVCGLENDGSVGLFSGTSEVREADVWHDALPAGARYFFLDFHGVIPHVRGEGATAQRVPPPKVVYSQKCRYCAYTVKKDRHTHCPKCSWMPMLEVTGSEEVT